MALRQTWTFDYIGEAIQEAAEERAQHHRERLLYWQEEEEA